MAVIDSVPGVEVTVVVNGQPLHEYEDSEIPDQKDKATRRIEAVSEQIFEIHIKVKQGTAAKGDCIAADVYIDGKWKDGPLVPKSIFSKRDAKGRSLGVDLPGGMIRKYCFSALELASDSRAFKGEVDRLSRLGSIEVKLTHVILGKKEPTRYKENEELGIVSEKALKGRSVSHSVGLKPATKGGKPDVWNTSPVDPSGKPAGTITFLYSSRESLKAMLIIPRTPTPPPLEEKDKLDEDEVKRLQAEMRAIKAKQEETIRIKRERTDDTASPRPRKAARAYQGDVLLSIDDNGNVQTASTQGLERRQEKEVITIEDDSDSD